MLFRDACAAYIAAATNEIGHSPRTIEVYRERLALYDKYVGEYGVANPSLDEPPRFSRTVG